MTVLPTPEVKTQTPETIFSKPWAEIKESFKAKPYWQYLREKLRGIIPPQNYKTAPDIHKNQRPEDIREVDTQITKTTLDQLVQFLGLSESDYTQQGGTVYIQDKTAGGTIKARIDNTVAKLQIDGSKYDPDYKEPNVLTRIYLGLDPRYATDEFFLLVKELIASGALSENMAVALNLDEQRHLDTNNVIIIIPKSEVDQERFAKIFAAYQNARISDAIGFNPFGLDKQQRDHLAYGNLRTYKYLLDDMTAVVEMAADDGNNSYDVKAFSDINNAANIDPKDNDGKVINKLLQAAKGNWVVYNNTDKEARYAWAQAKMAKDGSDLKFVGTKLHSKRNLKHPALVEIKTHQVVQAGQATIIRSLPQVA